MNCEYSITINGKKKILFTLDGKDIRIDSYDKLISELRRQSLKNPEYFEKLLSELKEVSKFDEVHIDDINENSVGFYNPADLISDLAKNNTEQKY